jgi:hypothetical protein
MLLYYRELGRLPASIGGEVTAIERSLLSRLHQHAKLGQAWRVGTASFLVVRGQHAAARELYGEAVAYDFDTVPGAQRLCRLNLAADLCAVFDDGATAARLAGLHPYADLCAVITCGFGVLGPVAYFLGQLASVRRDWDEADEHFRTALETNRRLGAQPLVARTRLEYGRMILRRGTPATLEAAWRAGGDAVARAESSRPWHGRAAATRPGQSGIPRAEILDDGPASARGQYPGAGLDCRDPVTGHSLAAAGVEPWHAVLVHRSRGFPWNVAAGSGRCGRGGRHGPPGVVAVRGQRNAAVPRLHAFCMLSPCSAVAAAGP